MSRRFYLGVASLNHITTAVELGVCQFGHGNRSSVAELGPGDWLVYYATREFMDSGDKVQAFTAIGEVSNGEIESVSKDGRAFYCRPVEYRIGAREVSVREVLDDLTFVSDKRNWGISFRGSKREIPGDDFRVIAKAMGIAPPDED